MRLNTFFFGFGLIVLIDTWWNVNVTNTTSWHAILKF